MCVGGAKGAGPEFCGLNNKKAARMSRLSEKKRCWRQFSSLTLSLRGTKHLNTPRLRQR